MPRPERPFEGPDEDRRRDRDFAPSSLSPPLPSQEVDGNDGNDGDDRDDGDDNEADNKEDTPSAPRRLAASLSRSSHRARRVAASIRPLAFISSTRSITI